jgi:hypothetical protein
MLVELIFTWIIAGLFIWAIGKPGKRTIIVIASLLSSLSVVVFLINALLLGFSDRMPRSDVDKESVYDQMNSH